MPLNNIVYWIRMKQISPRRKSFVFFFCASNLLVLFLLICAFKVNRRKFQKALGQETHATLVKNTTSRLMTATITNELPVCAGNLLDKDKHPYEKQQKEFYNSWIISPNGSCRLLHYTTELVVTCFDTSNYRNRIDPSPYSNIFTNHAKRSSNTELYFVFIGDSRIRQQFYNFVKMFPDYDKQSQPSVIPTAYHGDINVTSSILRLRVSFQWRPVIDETVLKTINQWATNDLAGRPCMVLLGMAVHHMVPIRGTDEYKFYQQKIVELAPILGRLANISRVIWLNQYPTLDLYGERPRNYHIYSEKIHRYNKAARTVLENYKSIRIWDSSNPLAEEYVRSCIVLQRDVVSSPFKTVVDYATTFVNCFDYVHPGSSALSEATQLLLNDMCNIV